MAIQRHSGVTARASLSLPHKGQNTRRISILFNPEMGHNLPLAQWDHAGPQRQLVLPGPVGPVIRAVWPPDPTSSYEKVVDILTPPTPPISRAPSGAQKLEGRGERELP